MKRRLIILALLCAASLNAKTLNEVVADAVETNPQICSRYFDFKSNQWLVKRANSRFLPQANVMYNTGPEMANNNSTRSLLGGESHFRRAQVDLNVSQTLFDGGERSSGLRQRLAFTKRSNYQFCESREIIAFQAAEAFFNVMRFRGIVGIYFDDVEAHEKMLTRVSKRVKGGAGVASETQLAESRLALAKARLIQAQGQLDEAENQFKEYVGYMPPEDLEMPEVPEVPSKVEDALKKAYDFSPSICARVADVEAAGAQIGISKSALFPKLSFDVQAFQGDDLNGVPGSNVLVNGLLRIRWDFFTAGGNSAQISADRALYRKAYCDYEDSVRKVFSNVATSWDFFNKDIRRIVELENHRDEAFAVFESYGKEFDVGHRNLFDLLNSQIEYFNARVSYVDGNMDQFVDAYRLFAAMGLLNQTLNPGDCCEQ